MTCQANQFMEHRAAAENQGYQEKYLNRSTCLAIINIPELGYIQNSWFHGDVNILPKPGQPENIESLMKYKSRTHQNQGRCSLLKLRKAPDTPLHQMIAKGCLVRSDAAAIDVQTEVKIRGEPTIHPAVQTSPPSKDKGEGRKCRQ